MEFSAGRKSQKSLKPCSSTIWEHLRYIFSYYILLFRFQTTATIVEYVLEAEKNSKEKNPVVRTIGVGFDRTLGGLEITQRMTKHLEEVHSSRYIKELVV